MEQLENAPPRKKVRVTGRTRDVVIALDRGILVFARHWAAFFNLFILTYVGLPFLAPVLMHAGFKTPAEMIYTAYSPMCHQLGYRSWFLFGERSAYPRDVFQDYTGINPDDLWTARAFRGNERMGYKVAICERDVAIYGALFAGGVAYSLPFVRRRLKPMHWLAWMLIGIAPIAVDGFSQLFTQYPYDQLPLFSLLPSRESTPLLRTLTGALFGLANVWLAYPYVEESMREVQRELEVKLARVDAAKVSQ
jgi:uncharacterized membrane protein